MPRAPQYQERMAVSARSLGIHLPESEPKTSVLRTSLALRRAGNAVATGSPRARTEESAPSECGGVNRPRSPSVMRGRTRKHDEGGTGLEAEGLDLCDHLEQPVELLALSDLTPSGAHAESIGAARLGVARGPDGLCRIDDRLALELRVPVGRLGAVGAVLRAGAGLDAEERAELARSSGPGSARGSVAASRSGDQATSASPRDGHTHPKKPDPKVAVGLSVAGLESDRFAVCGARPPVASGRGRARLPRRRGAGPGASRESTCGSRRRPKPR